MNPAVQNHALELPEIVVPFYATVEFGQRLPNGNCGHVGICRAVDASFPAAAPPPRTSRCRFALARVLACGNGRPAFFFPRRKMRPCTARAFFSRACFIIPADFELPAQWQTQLPQLAVLTLAAGQYPIHKSDAGFLVKF